MTAPPYGLTSTAPIEGSGWQLTLADGSVVRAGARTGDWVVERR